MILKLLAFSFVFVLGAAGASGQTPPSEPHVFSFSFDDSGGYIGVRTEEVTRENFAKFGLREVRGVAVAEVAEDSPAKAAGLQKGDVIVRVNGDDVASSRKLTRLISEISPDHVARVTVLRDGAEREISVTVGKRPGPKLGDGSFAFPQGFERLQVPKFEDLPHLEKLPRFQGKAGEPFAWSFSNRRQIGVGLTPLTKQLSEHFGVEGGVLINTVRESSPAARSGLKAGDVIVEVDGKSVKGEFDVIRSIGEKKEGDVTVTFVRDRNRRTVTVTPEEIKGGAETLFEFSGTPAPGAETTPLNRLIIPGPIV